MQRQVSLFFVIITFTLFQMVRSGCSDSADCSHNGYCRDDRCNCYMGFFEEDCSQSVGTDYKSDVIILQVVFSVLFGCLTTLSAYACYRSIKNNPAGQALSTNIRAFVFALYAIMLFSQFLYVAIDPMMVWGNTPHIAIYIFYTFNYPLGIIALLGILFHWIDLINTSVETLKKEEMMQKINKFYKGKEITLEDMVEKVQFLRKLRIPFIITGFSVFVLLTTVNVMQGMNYKPEITSEINGPVILVCYGIECFGFLYYGRKLSKLIPYQLTKKVQRLTRRLSAYCLLVILIVAALIVVLRSIPVGKSPSLTFANFCAVETCVAALCFGAISIFLSWQKKFPFITFSEQTGSSLSGTLNSSVGNYEDASVVAEQDTEL